MTRKAPSPTKPTLGPERYVPTCTHCGFVGHPDEHATPYTYCGGDIRRHQRRPVAEAYRGAPPPLPAKPPLPAAGYRRPPARVSVGRGECGTCEVEYALMASTDGPVLVPHGPRGNPCRGTGRAPRVVTS